MLTTLRIEWREWFLNFVRSKEKRKKQRMEGIAIKIVKWGNNYYDLIWGGSRSMSDIGENAMEEDDGVSQ